MSHNFFNLPNIIESYSWFFTIFEYLTFDEIQQIATVNKNMAILFRKEQFFSYLNSKLLTQNNVYIPSKLPHNFTQRTFFLHAYPSRDVWKAHDLEDLNEKALQSYHLNRKANNRSKISVYAKFKPLTEKELEEQYEDDDDDDDNDNEQNDMKLDNDENNNENNNNRNKKGVYLPLYQRIAMLKLSHNVKDTKSALKILSEEGNWFDSRWKDMENSSDLSHGIDSKVFIAGETKKKDEKNMKEFLNNRIKYQKLKETNKNNKNSYKIISKVQKIDEKNNSVIMMTKDVGLRNFTYDGVLPTNTTQDYSYNLCTKKLVIDFFNGFNSTTIVYGQTGSGKTYTMFGPSVESSSNLSHAAAAKHTTSTNFSVDSETRGIIPRVCEEIFAGVKTREKVNNIKSKVFISYVEIFGDQVSDLLQYGARCSHSKVASQRFVLNGAIEREVTSIEDMNKYLEQGELQKRKAQTAMNERSSRAHSLLIITLEQELQQKSKKSDFLEEKSDKPIKLRSQMFLADLGGSEQVKKSKINSGKQRLIGEGEGDEITEDGVRIQQNSVGFELDDRMREAININLGLLALKKCVEALNNNALYIPYQESKLTLLLSEGLGGNSKTSIIICGSLAPQHSSETVATLRFGEKCSNLVTKTANNNVNLLKDIIDDLDSRIKSLEDEIKVKERWVHEEIESEDVIVLDNNSIQKNGIERKLVSKLVGAEKERKELIRLLSERARLIGAPLLDEEKDNKPVLGFGKESAELYGFGQKFDVSEEFTSKNIRFENEVKTEFIPEVIKKRKAKVAWATGEDISEDSKVLEKKAIKIKRTNLAYSGFSL